MFSVYSSVGFVKQHLVAFAFIAGVVLPFLVLKGWIIWLWRKKSKIQKKCYELCEEIEGLERRKALLEEELSGKLEARIKQELWNKYSSWFEAKRKAEEEKLNKQRIETIRQVSMVQEAIYADMIEKLEEAYKENKRLRQEISRLRQEIASLKGRFSNHVISVVRNAKFEILMHALKRRPDRKSIASALR